MGEDAKRAKFLSKSTRFFPFHRDDARHMVYGPCTSEAVDSYGTVFSLDATREALAEYEQWRTLRAMHDKIAAGTVPVLELDDQALHVGAQVTDPNEWAKVTSGTYKGFSIGFDPLDGRYEIRGGAEVFVFTRYRLIEISLVDRPSNPDCVFTLYRRAAHFLLAPKDAGWTWDWKTDADAILAKGGQALLAKACAWYDKTAADDDGDGYPDAKSAYKLPVAKLAAKDDDKLTLYFYGVAAAMAALNGARKGVAIPESEREAVYKTLASYYRLFDETPPEFQRRAQEDSMSMDEKQLEAAAEKAVSGFFARLFGRKTEGQAEEPKVQVKAASLEAAQGLRAELAGLGAPAAKALEALDAAMAKLEAQEPASQPEAAPQSQPDNLERLEQRLVKLEEENRLLKEGLDKALAARKSQETVEGQKPFKSRYNGAFFG